MSGKKRKKKMHLCPTCKVQIPTVPDVQNPKSKMQCAECAMSEGRENAMCNVQRYSYREKEKTGVAGAERKEKRKDVVRGCILYFGHWSLDIGK